MFQTHPTSQELASGPCFAGIVMPPRHCTGELLDVNDSVNGELPLNGVSFLKSQLDQTDLPALANLNGLFSVVSKSGCDVTPKGQLRRAMLCVLLLSANQSCSRRALIEMFWASSPPEKASASLRSALSELRKDLCVLGKDVIHADRTAIRIDPKKLKASAVERNTNLVFLDGLDLAMLGAEGFEAWLRARRAERADAIEDIAHVSVFNENKTVPAIGILPCRIDQTTAALELAVHRAQNAVFDTLADVVELRIFDYRDSFGLTGAKQEELKTGNGPRIVVQTEHVPAISGVRFQLLDTVSNEIIWTGELADCVDPAISESFGNIAGLVDQIITALHRAPSVGEFSLISPYQAIISMFHLKTDRMDELQLQLESSAISDGRAVHHALLAYLATVRTGEAIGFADMTSPATVIEVARMTTQSDEFKPLNLAMAGYTLNYLAGETDLALDLAEQAVSLGPNQAFCWDQLALCYFSAGYLNRAAKAAHRAQSFGIHSPIRYTYDSTAAMIAYARGDYQNAARFGNRALFRMPRFTPALTYTAAALVQMNQLGDGRRLIQQLRRARPGFNTQTVHASLHLPDVGDFKQRYIAGLKRAGLS